MQQKTDHDELETRSKAKTDLTNVDWREDQDAEEVKDSADEDQKVEEVGQVIETTDCVAHVNRSLILAALACTPRRIEVLH